MIRTIIIDDEPLARKGIRKLLKQENDVEVIAECEDGVVALEAIETLRPDLVFLDIQMPELDGFQVLAELNLDPLPLVIFATAYDDFALKAFQVHAVDYLLKPVAEDHFHKALARARQLLQSSNSAAYVSQLENLIRDVQKRPEFVERFLIRKRGKLIVLPLEHVQVFEAQGDYINLVTTSGAYLHRESLTRLAQQLDPTQFIRINRSTIVRISLIRELEPLSKGDYVITLGTKTTYTLSRVYREAVLNALK